MAAVSPGRQSGSGSSRLSLAWPVGLVDLPEIQVNMYKPTLAVARTGAGTECDGDVCEDAWM